ncbi:hypothetical protein SHIRM173S_09655 [Streptomyces hirsutus]
MSDREGGCDGTDGAGGGTASGPEAGARVARGVEYGAGAVPWRGSGEAVPLPVEDEPDEAGALSPPAKDRTPGLPVRRPPVRRLALRHLPPCGDSWSGVPPAARLLALRRAALRSGTAPTPARAHTRGRFQRAVGAEARGERTELVEDLDHFVVGAGFRQQFPRRRQGLARPRGRTEPRLRVRLQQSGHDLPQRLGDALGSPGRPVFGEVLDEGLGVRLGALQQVQRDQAHGEQVCGEVRFGAHHLFRREIAGCAHHQVGLGQAGLSEPHGDTEVRTAAAVACPCRSASMEDVGGLDVAACGCRPPSCTACRSRQDVGRAGGWRPPAGRGPLSPMRWRGHRRRTGRWCTLASSAAQRAPLLLTDQLLDLLGRDLTAQGGQHRSAARRRLFSFAGPGGGPGVLEPRPGVVCRLLGGLTGADGGLMGGQIDLRRHMDGCGPAPDTAGHGCRTWTRACPAACVTLGASRTRASCA